MVYTVVDFDILLIEFRFLWSIGQIADEINFCGSNEPNRSVTSCASYGANTQQEMPKLAFGMDEHTRWWCKLN